MNKMMIKYPLIKSPLKFKKYKRRICPTSLRKSTLIKMSKKQEEKTEKTEKKVEKEKQPKKVEEGKIEKPKKINYILLQILL